MVRIPVEYQEVEYLESNGSQYLNLPYGFLDTDEIELVCEIHSTDNDKYMISPSVWNNDDNRFAMAGNYHGDFKVGFGSQGTLYGSFTPTMPLDALKHTWRYKNRLFTMLDDGTQIAVSDVSSVNFGNETNYLRLFYGYNASTAGRVYSFKQVKQSGESLNLIPCYRKSDNEPGMYDTVTKQFFTNAGTGTFIVGNDVSWDTASLIERRRQILLNTPHITTESANPLTFQTDISANLKDCKIYFEPVQEGSGDPSPDNVRPISGWDGVTVARNWFANISSYENSVDGVTFTRNPESGIITIKGKATARVQRAFSGSFIANGDNYIFQNFPVLSGGLYWYVWDLTSSSMIRNGVLDLNDVKLKPTSGHNFSIAINIPKNATVDFTFKPVIYDETEAITLPFPQTIYGGYVDLVKGEVVETWKNYDYPVNPNMFTDLENGYYEVGFGEVNGKGYGSSANSICSVLTYGCSKTPTIKTGYTLDYVLNSKSNRFHSVIYSETPITQNTARQWFIDNNVQLVREMYTSTTHQLTDGLNHITLGQDISPRPNGRSSTGGYANSSVIGSDGCTFVYFELGWTTEEFLQYSADISRRSEFVSDSRVLASSTTANAKLGDMVLSTASTTDYDGDALAYLYVSLPSDCTDLESKRAYLAEHPVKITYPKKTPIPYTVDLTDLKPVKGTNNVWSDANGNIEVKFWKH